MEWGQQLQSIFFTIPLRNSPFHQRHFLFHSSLECFLCLLGPPMLMSAPGGPYQITFQPPPIRHIMEQVRPKHIQLPPMKRVTETLGALGTIAAQFLIRRSTSPGSKHDDSAISSSSLSSSPTNYHDLFPAATSHNYTGLTTGSSQNHFQFASPHPPKLKPEEDEQLLSALYTLGRNVLGQVRQKCKIKIFMLQQVLLTLPLYPCVHFSADEVPQI